MAVWAQDDIDTLDNALADGKGARSIQFADQKVEFHSIKDMLMLRSVMSREVNGTSYRSRRFAGVSKGTPT